MTCNPQQAGQTNATAVYQIRLKGHLGPEWGYWFDGLQITLTDAGETLLTGPVADQAALHGLLKKVRDIGMPLLAVNCLDPIPTHEHPSHDSERQRKDGD